MNEAYERRQPAESEWQASATQTESIWDGIRAAEAEGRPIDHRTARLIAERVHKGPETALHAFALRGEVVDGQGDEEPTGTLAELVQQQHEWDAEHLRWIDALANHIASRPDKRPVRGWNDLTGSPELMRLSWPRIHVVSLGDEQAGGYLGTWLDADEDPDVLAIAVDELLDQSAVDQPASATWDVIDYQGFYGLDLFRLAEADGGMSLALVSRVALGLRDHGTPFAALIDLEGVAEETCEQFEARYRGEWQSIEDYVKSCAEDFGWERAIAELPEWLQRYVKIDYGMLANELRDNISVVGSPAGGVYVFADE